MTDTAREIAHRVTNNCTGPHHNSQCDSLKSFIEMYGNTREAQGKVAGAEEMREKAQEHLNERAAGLATRAAGARTSGDIELEVQFTRASKQNEYAAAAIAALPVEDK